MSDSATHSSGGIDWRPNSGHWGAVSKTIHWIMALMIIGMIGMGWYMTDLRDPETGRLLPQAYDLYQIHKSFGFTVMALALFRLIWRLTGKDTPSLPAAMPGWQKLGAHVSHYGLYILMIIMPISGWVMVSASPLQIPTKYFGLFTIPHLPTGSDRELAEAMVQLHEVLAWGFVVLISLHVLAALKHTLIDRDGILGRILPGRPSR